MQRYSFLSFLSRKLVNLRMLKIVYLDAATFGGFSLEPIASLGELVCYPTTTAEQAMERVSDADVLIVNKVRVTEALLDAAPRLKLVCEAATGVNNIDLDACARRGIPVRNVVGYSTDSVAQLTFTQILRMLCNVQRYDSYVKSGAYFEGGIFTDVSDPFVEIAGKTIGIIGMGAIGQAVARIAVAFGMKVMYYSTSGTGHCALYPCVSLEELLRSSDVVSVHCPLTPATDALIGEAELAMMKPTAVIVNMARGGIVAEKALADALDAGIITAAAIDVYCTEPVPSDHPYMTMAHPERMFLTPHVGWASREAIVRLIGKVAENISDMFPAGGSLHETKDLGAAQ